MNEISTDKISAIDMDKRSALTHKPVDNGIVVDGNTSERRSLRSSVVRNLSRAANEQKEMKYVTTGKKRSTSAKSSVGKRSKPTGSAAKKDVKSKATRAKSPVKKTAVSKTSKAKSPVKKTAATKTNRAKSSVKKTAATKTSRAKSPVKKTAATKTSRAKIPGKKPAATKTKKPRKSPDLKKQKAKTDSKSPKK